VFISGTLHYKFFQAQRVFEKPKSVLGYAHKGGYGYSRGRDLTVF
jgi:hypothetical protein